LKWLKEDKEVPEDVCTLIGKEVAVSLRSLPERERAMADMDIKAVLFKYKFGQEYHGAHQSITNSGYAGNDRSKSGTQSSELRRDRMPQTSMSKDAIQSVNIPCDVVNESRPVCWSIYGTGDF